MLRGGAGMLRGAGMLSAGVPRGGMWEGGYRVAGVVLGRGVLLPMLIAVPIPVLIATPMLGCAG